MRRGGSVQCLPWLAQGRVEQGELPQNAGPCPVFPSRTHSHAVLLPSILAGHWDGRGGISLDVTSSIQNGEQHGKGRRNSLTTAMVTATTAVRKHQSPRGGGDYVSQARQQAGGIPGSCSLGL